MTILSDIYAAIEATKPIVYYATEETLPRGKVMRCAPVFGFPEWWLFNPEDFEENQRELSAHCRFVHLRDWVPTPEIGQTFERFHDDPPLVFGAHSWRNMATGKDWRL